VIVLTDIEAALRTAWPDARLARPPVPITGGEWAEMWRLEVQGTPEGVPRDLVLRRAPDEAMGAKEVAAQRAAAEAGVATPAVHLSGPSWSVMDFVTGSPLLAGLALRHLPAIARRLPDQLAGTMAAIHRTDPGPIVQAVRGAAPTVALTLDELWPHLRGAAETCDPDLVAALDGLADRRPPPGGEVLCHGDLHPFNVLADGDRLTVIDWTGAVVAPPAFDVAFTWMLLRYPPLVVPAPLRPVVGGAAGWLARRFVGRYRAANPAADVERLEWYAAVHAVRVLIDLAGWRQADDPRARSHPWRLVEPGVRGLLAASSRRPPAPTPR
jgi:aminoglycoside phosphotransferase (APT) family kinase protein